MVNWQNDYPGGHIKTFLHQEMENIQMQTISELILNDNSFLKFLSIQISSSHVTLEFFMSLNEIQSTVSVNWNDLEN